LNRLNDYFNKPEYVFRPRQLLRRFGPRPKGPDDIAEVLLPWGLPFRIRPQEVLGRAIWNTGVYDLAVSEALWRLTDPGETVVDAGANIGIYTSLFARRVGTGGHVWAYEPHPAVFRDLSENSNVWPATTVARLRLRQAALSDGAGEASLFQGETFTLNRGASMITADGRKGLTIERVTLDDEVGPVQTVGVMKVDVEGHEGAVMRGAERVLRRHAVRDIVFEEHGGEPGEASHLLASSGYQLFRILKGFLGLTLTAATRRMEQALMPPSFLATIDPQRAAARMSARGWQCLR
jgi:FkbM family methyltransferase